MQLQTLDSALFSEILPTVNSFNEWDPLEEVIVGVVDGACLPPWHCSISATIPDNQFSFFQQNASKPFPQERIQAATADLDEFVRILELEGVMVRRPEPLDHSIAFASPDWKSQSGLYQAMPRDLLLVLGDEIIETPMAWRSRYFEIHAYRKLLKEYFKSRARWSSAPKPQLSDELYNELYQGTSLEHPKQFAINEFEPTFDAADVIRCGRDLFVQKSNVTNIFGIEWLRKHLEGRFVVHELDFDDSHPMHIDATFMPLAPGHLLVNPGRVRQIPEMFKSWNVIYAPTPCIPDHHPLYMTSKWITMNIFMLDEKRVMVERNETPLINLLKKNGFEPILCSFRNFNSFGGSFHCATLDIRRKGRLQSYF